MAKAWERAFIKFVSSYSGKYIKVHYSAEVSQAHYMADIIPLRNLIALLHSKALYLSVKGRAQTHCVNAAATYIHATMHGV